MKSEDKLFIELTNEEASSVTGGNARAVFAEVAQIIATGGPNQGHGVREKVRGVLFKYQLWFSNGGGIILGDVKGGRGDFTRLSFNTGIGGRNIPDDLTNGWDWGVTRNGKTIKGGFGGPKW